MNNLETRFEWTDANVELLIQYATVDGFSFRQIGKLLGCTSRNQPLCKFNRMRAKDPTLQHVHGSHSTRKPRAAPTHVPVKRVKPITEEPAEALPAALGEDGSLVTYLTVVRNMCRFPIGDPREAGFHICGNTTKELSSYCEHHHQMCYVPIVRKFKEHRGKRSA